MVFTMANADECKNFSTSDLLKLNQEIVSAIKIKKYLNAKNSAALTICILENLNSDEKFNYENYYHDAHQLLGLIAFMDNDIELASKELLKSIREEKKDSILSSYGPRGELARLLISKGLKKYVIEYLRLAISISFFKEGENSRGQMECCLNSLKKDGKCIILEKDPDNWINFCSK